MGNIHRTRYTHLNNGALSYWHLNNKVEDEWKSLAFGGRGTYNPANREKGQGAFAFDSGHLYSRGPCQEAGIPKQDLDKEWSRWNAVAAER